MAINSLYPFSVEKDINLEQLDTEKGIWMPCADYGLNAIFSGVFSEMLQYN